MVVWVSMKRGTKRQGFWLREMRRVEGKKIYVRSLMPPTLTKPDKGYIDSKPNYWMLIEGLEDRLFRDCWVVLPLLLV